MREIAALTKSKEFEIRMRYEYGEDLKSLSFIYKVSYNTLKKRKEKSELKGDAWIKGSRVTHAYECYAGEAEKRKKEIEDRINDSARREINQIQNLIDDAYGAEEIVIDGELEAAISTRVPRIQTILGLKRSIENVLGDKEKAEIEKIKIDTELKKAELEAKRIDLELKKKEAEYYLKGE
ncbi:hypothetical protein [Fusobacterium varium]|uniref:hypothetical protein n=1 Tax=Fusobacterium varium TaxID=856 RepID=UPI003561380C